MRIARSHSSAVVLLILAASGCSNSPSDPGAPAITGMKRTIHWISTESVETSPARSDLLYVDAYLREGQKWTLYSGDVAPDATFHIDGAAPNGAYWLRSFDGTDFSKIPHYIWTDATKVDLSKDDQSRPDVHPALSAQTTLIVNATGLSPLQDTDQTNFFISNVGFAISAGPYYATNTPSRGDEALTNLSFTWAALPLLNAPMGDHAVIAQLRTVTDSASGFVYQTPIRIFESDPIQLMEGETAEISGAFKDVAPFDYRVNWSRSAFAALRTKVHPSRAGELANATFWVHAEPAGASHGELPWNGSAYNLVPQVIDSDPLDEFHQHSDDLKTTLHAGNPYPPEWLLSKFEVDFPVRLPSPEGDEAVLPATLDGFVGVIAPTMTIDGTPVVPVITPPQAAKINGNDLRGTVKGVGLTPTLSWSAPATGIPTAYELHLVQLSVLSSVFSGKRIQAAEVAVLHVPGDTTQVSLPPDLLQEGTSYLVRIRAVAQAGQDVRTEPFRQRAPTAYADLFTDYFQP